MPSKSNPQIALCLRILFSCPKEIIERGTQVGFYYVEFLGRDRDHIRAIIDDKRTAILTLLCISSAFLANLKPSPREPHGVGARTKVFTRIRVSA